MYTLSWILTKWPKLNSGFFSEKNIISSNQPINIYSNEVKNRHVQFGDPPVQERFVTANTLLWLPHRESLSVMITRL